MVHLAIKVAHHNALCTFRIIQADQYPEMSQRAGVLHTPALVLQPGARLITGNLPLAHFTYHLWQTSQSRIP